MPMVQDDLETVEKHLIYQSARFIIEMHYGASRQYASQPLVMLNYPQKI